MHYLLAFAILLAIAAGDKVQIVARFIRERIDGLNRRWFGVEHLIAGEEPRDMQRNAAVEPRKPACRLHELFTRIVQPGNDEHGHFKVRGGATREGFDRVYGGSKTAAQFAIDFRGEAFRSMFAASMSGSSSESGASFTWPFETSTFTCPRA